MEDDNASLQRRHEAFFRRRASTPCQIVCAPEWGASQNWVGSALYCGTKHNPDLEYVQPRNDTKAATGPLVIALLPTIVLDRAVFREAAIVDHDGLTKDTLTLALQHRYEMASLRMLHHTVRLAADGDCRHNCADASR